MISVHPLSWHKALTHYKNLTCIQKYTENHELEVHFSQVCRLNFYPHFNLCLVLFMFLLSVLTKLSVSPAENPSRSMILWAPGFTAQIVLNGRWAVTHDCQIHRYSATVEEFLLCYFSFHRTAESCFIQSLPSFSLCCRIDQICFTLAFSTSMTSICSCSSLGVWSVWSKNRTGGHLHKTS